MKNSNILNNLQYYFVQNALFHALNIVVSTHIIICKQSHRSLNNEQRHKNHKISCPISRV
jgi:hypothetical protein